MKETSYTSSASTLSTTNTSPVLDSMAMVLSTLSEAMQSPLRCSSGSLWTREHYRIYPGASSLAVFASRVTTRQSSRESSET